MAGYEEQGYLYLKNFFSEAEIIAIENILNKFHIKWLEDNAVYYEKGLLNSHSLTSGNYLNEEEKTLLFKFITQNKLQTILKTVFSETPIFLNTQLFFDPKNSEQKNYWHRDIQYTGMSVEEQKKAIHNQNVVHFRIPMKKESGIELIPKTHREWDLPEEFDVRNSLNGAFPSDDLQRGKVVGLNRGDLLVFSANMIHRGLYGHNRFSLDVLFCDNIPEMRNFIDRNNYPSKEILENLGNKEMFDF
ncbi:MULTISPECIES: phytanoyl-CoA dioxygenase family protein [Flavobacterium]|jgi:ectoine hydroxylase-related dioxygenase (phytanoyl-CoA dioxygenase family)|uniref:phytanoyl-CoA dioxygenase family protein n=1 Tax=Flavobacterium TaxID=237 RepID=UPI0006F4C52D|nr:MULTISPECIES: phytanoyl-CoA dioxygenase family protein [Flavobacterium]KQS46452.1 phytanoyl-CoA dioxygenase [Flavobacterium sp. Leaf359]